MRAIIPSYQITVMLPDSAVASGSFNGDWGVTYTLDTNANTYEIWYANKTSYFFINDVLLHTLSAAAASVSIFYE